MIDLWLELKTTTSCHHGCCRGPCLSHILYWADESRPPDSAHQHSGKPGHSISALGGVNSFLSALFDNLAYCRDPNLVD